MLCTSRPAAGQAKEYFLYAGTYTGFKYVLHGNPAGESHSEGIYVSQFRPATGDLTQAKLAAKIRNPSWRSLPINAFSMRPAKIQPPSGPRAITNRISALMPSILRPAISTC
jgi:6-phosphogluconolactonase